jgi:iron complex outermembrane receptor protein
MMQGNDNGFVYRGRVSYKNAYGLLIKTQRFPIQDLTSLT